MAVVCSQHDKPELQITTRRTPPQDRGTGILIIGSCPGDTFVATEVLIHADTIGAEEAIRTWLGEHDIHVTMSNGETASTDNGSSSRAPPRRPTTIRAPAG
jgi:hypothetical protein